MTSTFETSAKEQLTVNDIRYNNKVNLFTDIVSSTGITRNDLAVKNNISFMTAKNIVDELLGMDLIEEHLLNSSVGRKPTALQVKSNYGNVVCINLSSINELRFIIYDLRGTTLASQIFTFKPREKTVDEKIDIVINAIKKCLEDIPTETIGITALVPGIYYEKEDILRFAVDRELDDLHIKEILKEAFDIQNIQIIHDTLAFANAEYELDNIGDYSQFYLYCGEGVGGCFTNFDGKPVFGENLLAGEIGNIIHSWSKDGKPVRLETLLSIAEMRQRLPERYHDMTFSEVLKMSRTDSEVAAVVNKAFPAVSEMLYNIVWLFNPTKIVVDSYCNEYADLIVKNADAFLKKHFEEDSLHKTRIIAAKSDEYHTMKWCMKYTRLCWIEQIVSTETGLKLVSERKEGIV